MVDWYGRWTYDPANTNEDDWCDLDYAAHWMIEEMNYTPSCNLELFIRILLDKFEEDVEYHEEYGKFYYAVPDDRAYPDSLMLNVPDFAAWVYDQGGLAELEAEYSVYCPIQ